MARGQKGSDDNPLTPWDVMLIALSQNGHVPDYKQTGTNQFAKDLAGADMYVRELEERAGPKSKVTLT